MFLTFLEGALTLYYFFLVEKTISSASLENLTA